MKSSSVRTQIVETASRLFYRQGYNATGINQIIEEAQVAKGSLYLHFPSKEDLLVEYLTVTGKDTNESLAALIKNCPTPKEKIMTLFEFLERFSLQTEYQGCQFLNVASEIPKDNVRVKRLIKKQKDEIRALFKSILLPVGKEDLADEFYLLFEAGLIAAKVHEQSWTARTAKKIADKLI